MNKSIIKLPLFPLDIFLLPDGVTRLRIFEARYLKLVSLAITSGFIITSNNASSHNDGNAIREKKWGSWVDIINFDQGKDGILEIDVKCRSLVEIIDIDDSQHQQINSNQAPLQFVNVKAITHWAQDNPTESANQLLRSLQTLFNGQLLLQHLYNNKVVNNSHWVVARWLELLPIPFEIKKSFIFKHNYHEAKTLVNSIIFKDIH
ncbi:hypothetical protein E2R68_05775 [Psychromonas sp. RZ22]|uniref:LON peptidase substrate-binding domain-containing protein n=1 Tax=Psychromonas algarum TaxID=2555643 RepID=UPI001067F336|nr:LON peptidase substrate-binding domain-containing protein [Psychromonas sp. RZ22]TEW55263.1 hypothetical protein E2R68_05775 [Psychromonas sp. RZ22]